MTHPSSSSTCLPPGRTCRSRTNVNMVSSFRQQDGAGQQNHSRVKVPRATGQLLWYAPQKNTAIEGKNASFTRKIPSFSGKPLIAIFFSVWPVMKLRQSWLMSCWFSNMSRTKMSSWDTTRPTSQGSFFLCILQFCLFRVAHWCNSFPIWITGG